MCGLFGYSLSRAAASDVQRGILCAGLARSNDDRGGHSWGYAAPTDVATVIERGMGDAYPATARLAAHAVLMGHTRFATTGEASVANAHPFAIGSVVGAHNGMLWNHAELGRQYGRTYAVDSMHLIAHLDAGLPFNDIEGYGALSWLDARTPGRLYLSRMARGELAVYGIGTIGAVLGVVWSSREDHLLEALEAAGLDAAFEYDTSLSGDVKYVQNHGLYDCKTVRCDLGERTPAPLTVTSSTAGLTGASSVAPVTKRQARKARRRAARRAGGATATLNTSTLLWTDEDPWEEYQRQAEEAEANSDDAPETDDVDGVDRDETWTDAFMRRWRDGGGEVGG